MLFDNVVASWGLLAQQVWNGLQNEIVKEQSRNVINGMPVSKTLRTIITGAYFGSKEACICCEECFPGCNHAFKILLSASGETKTIFSQCIINGLCGNVLFSNLFFANLKDPREEFLNASFQGDSTAFISLIWSLNGF